MSSTPKTGRPRGTITRRFTLAGYEITIRRLAPKRARKTNPDGLYPPIPKPLPPMPKPPGAPVPPTEQTLGTSTITTADPGVTTVRHSGPGGAPEVSHGE